MAKLKDFGDPVCHAPRTASVTLTAIRIAHLKQNPPDYKAFLKLIRELGLNVILDPFWRDWWCIAIVGAQEFNFQFSLIQTTVGYWSFDDDVSKLKQVTGCDHWAVQHYLIGVIAGAVPTPCFTDDTLLKISNTLQEFHNHKDAVVHAGGQRDNWEIPKLELLQGVVPDIRHSGPIMQWSADPTEHAHSRSFRAGCSKKALLGGVRNPCHKWSVAVTKMQQSSRATELSPTCCEKGNLAADEYGMHHAVPSHDQNVGLVGGVDYT
ncbi:hypothetical protein OG21DRAFT_1528098 [Imleria badia]|nr:hypothetical protein OG21DRAFT_1528098 [Imleria badia]